jgi:hypothetical protein
MPNEALVAQVKHIIGMAKSGQVEQAYAAYKTLFESKEFVTYSVEDRRTAIKLVVNAKIPPVNPAQHIVDAHRAAMRPLEEMIGEKGDPNDFLLLGICCLFIGDEKRAGNMFRAGLNGERERNPQSDLCGALMKWVAAV